MGKYKRELLKRSPSCRKTRSQEPGLLVKDYRKIVRSPSFFLANIPRPRSFGEGLEFDYEVA